MFAPRLQVDPDVFAALPKDLQEELKSAYNRGTHNQAQAKICMSMYVCAEISCLFILKP